MTLLPAGEYAIVGLGVTPQGALAGATSISLRSEALLEATADAGLSLDQIGGYVFQNGMTEFGDYGRVGELPRNLGWRPNFMWNVDAGGGGAALAVLGACAAVGSGLADYVAVGYGDTPRSGGVTVGKAGHYDPLGPTTQGAYGFFSSGAEAALSAQRHMFEFGTTREHLASVACAARDYALLRPDAVMHGRELTVEGHLSAPFVAEPLGRYDYCLVADGACALIVTSLERARDLPKRAVRVAGVGSSTTFGLDDGSKFTSLDFRGPARAALGTAGVGLADVDVAQLYDCFTITVLMTLEGLGFCEPGEGGPFVSEGNLSLDGSIPTNTGGGELSWGYMQGFTPFCEAVRQLRGESDATQVADAEVCLVTGHGGVGKEGNLEFTDSCTILTVA